MSSQSEETCERRTRLLDAATELFHHYGFQKTTVADIARQAGVGVGSVYLEFSGKDAIIEALSAHRYGQVLRAMEAASRPGPPFEARLTGAFDARAHTFWRLAESGTHAPELVHCHCPGTLSAHGRYIEAERALLASILRDGASAGALSPVDADHGARTLQAAYAIASPPWMFKQDKAEILDILQGLHQVVIRGLLPR